MRAPAALILIAALLAVSSCSLKRMAVNSMANTLAEGGDVFARDDDPELVRDALPFGLKTMEALLETVPKHRGLLLAACQGFTQYAYAFVQLDAERIEPRDYDEALRLQQRALKLFVRARDYGLRGLEVKHRDLGDALRRSPQTAVAVLTRDDVPLLYWTAAAWGSAINLGKDRPDLTADIASVRTMIERGLALDESYGSGAFHQAMIVMESLPPAMGGSPERARRHFERSVELAGGADPLTFVTMAQSVDVATQNRTEFRELLQKALAIDPDQEPSTRLSTLIAQRKARDLLEREDDLFLEPDTTSAEEPR